MDLGTTARRIPSEACRCSRRWILYERTPDDVLEGSMQLIDKRNLVAQWAFDTRPVLLRFHLWLEDVEVERAQPEPVSEHAFTPSGIARCLAMTSAATALGTRLFGGFGEGAGETPEMGANPLLGFGRVYARPEVARVVDRRVRRLLNEPGHTFEQFYGWLQGRGITLWGAAVDTLAH